MQTVHPSIMLGSYLWDEERLPLDEFDIRLASLQEAIKARGWAGAMVYGDAREHSNLAWLTNFIPRMRWAMALFRADGEKRILASMSSRDMPAMRTMTMIANVKSGWEWKWFDEWVGTLGDGAPIGTIGFDQITPLLSGAVERSLGGKFQLVAADEIVQSARQQQRPREIAVIREAAAITQAASREFRAAWEKGDDIETAALAAERTARELAAQDIRTLVSRDGGRTLQPYRGSFDDRPDRLLGYVAVKYLGYWADSFVQIGEPERLTSVSQNALRALMAGIESGASFDNIASTASAQIGTMTLHPALSGGFGGRIGLSPLEGEMIRPGAAGSAQNGTAYSLKAGVVDSGDGGSIASALVVTRPSGGLDVLLTSDGNLTI